MALPMCWPLSSATGFTLGSRGAATATCRRKSRADFITWAAVFGVMLGGRLGQMLFYDWQEWLHDPLMVFRVWEGGMASHGGMLGPHRFSRSGFRAGTSFRGRASATIYASSRPSACSSGASRISSMASFTAAPHNVSWAVQFPKELYDDKALAARATDALAAATPPVSGAQDFPDSIGAIVDATRHDPRVREILARC